MTHNFGSQISDICVPFLIHHPSSHSYSFLEHHFTLTVLFPSMRNTRSTSIRCTKANDKRGRKGAKWGEHQTSRLFDSDIQKKIEICYSQVSWNSTCFNIPQGYSLYWSRLDEKQAASWREFSTSYSPQSPIPAIWSRMRWSQLWLCRLRQKEQNQWRKRRGSWNMPMAPALNAFPAPETWEITWRRDTSAINRLLAM